MNDSFSVLGLPVGAGSEDVQLAYHRLAKIWHPDRAGGNAARFHQIAQAYDRLQAPAHDPKPDLLRQRFFRDLSKKTRPKQMETSDTIYPLRVTLSDLMKGAVRRLTLDDGTALDVKIPKGHDPSQKLRIARKLSLSDRPKTMVLVQLKVREEPKFELVKRNVKTRMTLALPVLRGGGMVSLTAPTGRLRVKIPMLSSDGDRLRLVGKGLPEQGEYPAGDLLIELVAEPAAGLSKAIEQFTHMFIKERKMANRS